MLTGILLEEIVIVFALLAIIMYLAYIYAKLKEICQKQNLHDSAPAGAAENKEKNRNDE